MKTKYVRAHLRGIVVSFFVSFSLFVFCASATAHDDADSHKVFKAIGDAYRAVMDSKNGMGGSVFSLYVELDAVITDGTNKSVPKNLVEKLGTAFIPECDGCNGRFLLTNKHVADVAKIKKDHDENIREFLNFPPGVDFHITESYKAVDSQGVTFLVSLVKKSDSDDIALFKFENEPSFPRMSFVLQDEDEISLSPIGLLGSPLEISNMLGTGNMARAEPYECIGKEAGKFLVIMAPVNHGNSGGPIYNFETDKVNGMATLYLLTEEKGNSMISCAVPASTLIRFLKETVPPKEKSHGKSTK